MKYIIMMIMTLFFIGCTHKTNEPNLQNKKSVEDVIPMTMSNIRGHKSLYDEGWFVVTSSKESIKYAKQHGIVDASNAIKKSVKSIKSRTKNYSSDMKDTFDSSLNTTASIYKKGTNVSKKIYDTGTTLASRQISYGVAGFEKAWDRFIQGNLYLGKRTKREREELLALPGNYFNNIKNDFSNISEISENISGDFGDKITKVWDKSLQKAQRSFQESYEKSGTRTNSLQGLFDIVGGYAKGAYYGAIKPTIQTTASTIEAGGRKATSAVFLPVATITSVTGRTIESIGMSIYYTGKTAVKIISPTVEAGLLSGLSILSISTAPITYGTGATVGAINQVSTTVAAPVVGTTQAVGGSVYNSAKVAALVSYDAIKGTTEVIYHEAAAGVVLGYNALVALPTHIVMAAGDAAFFLAWDGPRLVVASVKGEVAGFSSGGLPVGSVVDLKKLKEVDGVEVNIVSQDPKVIKKVINELPKDLRK